MKAKKLKVILVEFFDWIGKEEYVKADIYENGQYQYRKMGSFICDQTYRRKQFFYGAIGRTIP